MDSPKVKVKKARGETSIYVDSVRIHTLDKIYQYRLFANGAKLSVFYSQGEKKKFMVVNLETNEKVFVELNPEPKKKSVLMSGASLFYIAKDSKQYFVCLESVELTDEELQRKLIDLMSKTG